MNIQQAVKASLGKFPFVVISEEDNDLIAETPSVLVIRKNSDILMRELADKKVLWERMVVTGDAKQAAKFIAGPFSGLFTRMSSPEEFLEIWTFWSPKITIGGSFIAAIDYSEPNPFVEHLVSLQNFINRKWSSLDFGNGYVSVRRSI